jgi:hypothetical protein
MENVEDVIVDLVKQGCVEEAELLSDAVGLTKTALSSEKEEQQRRFIDKAFSSSGASNTKYTISDKVITFKAPNGIDLIAFPGWLRGFMERLNRVGNKDYSLKGVRRKKRTWIDVIIGK